MRLFWVGLVIFLSGCHSGYIKQGATQQSYYADMTTCLKEISELTKGNGGSTTVSGLLRPTAQHNPFESEFEINMRNSCMENKGWKIGTGEGKFLPFN